MTLLAAVKLYAAMCGPVFEHTPDGIIGVVCMPGICADCPDYKKDKCNEAKAYLRKAIKEKE